MSLTFSSMNRSNILSYHKNKEAGRACSCSACRGSSRFYMAVRMERPGHLGPRQVPRENRPPGLDQMQGSVHGERRILVCLQLCWIKITANS